MQALDQLLNDPEIEEIWINSPTAIFIAVNGISQKVELKITSAEIELWVERLLISSHRRLDKSHPFVDASLSDGSRLHVAIPDLVKTDWAINIRKFISRMNSLSQLVSSKVMNQEIAILLEACVINGKNIVVAGGTGAGKTTLLNSLIDCIPANQRIITVEEVFELSVKRTDFVSMQTRAANLEGEGEIDLRELVRQSLRMRPERLIVGEVRAAEALDLLLAFNSGQPGFATLHANNVHSAVLKLCTLPLLAGDNVNAEFVVPTVANAVDLIVQVSRDSQGVRRIVEIGLLTGEIRNQLPEVLSIAKWNGNDWMGLPISKDFSDSNSQIDISRLWNGLISQNSNRRAA